MSLESAFMLVSIIINVLIAFYIYRQVRAAEISNQQSVMPILGITVAPALASEIARDIQSKQLEPIFGEKTREMLQPSVSVLKVYADFNIAKNISCRILKNGQNFYEFRNKKSAVPPKDGRVIICERDISEIIEELPEDEKIEFVAIFTFQSVLDSEFTCQYKLRTGKYLGQQSAELEFLKYPWKKK